MTKKIEITVDENGEIKVETLGFQGKGCLESSQWLKDLLGPETSRKLKPEYYKKDEEKVKMTQ